MKHANYPHYNKHLTSSQHTQQTSMWSRLLNKREEKKKQQQQKRSKGCCLYFSIERFICEFCRSDNI